MITPELLHKAKEKIQKPKELIHISSLRAKQLARGARPMVKFDSDNFLDIALFEIAEGKIEIDRSKSSKE
ncbi:MAG TPA: DNA-directed RNA polymerase subunit omega [Victivallales bacterium]|nr:DNA-directed RNA polymerase subunit omega [Victivallales bacterium]HPO89568.1 DNA-directed RNA polymerase subunit omega [Victivallales bacterium]HRR27900.1 DNA-directed RNA polymerase subunit omega [Victivallales bacterium]HRU00661.1 DNA-directed RNA polymerase subunit omega [Victivallales bacterium]